MDGHATYNEIFMAQVDVHKMASWCPGAIGTYKWVLMPFVLENADITYQHGINAIIRGHIGTIVKVYIDNIVVNSKKCVNILTTYFWTYALV